MNRNRTFLQLQEDVKTEMQLDPGLISDEERKRFINDAMDDIADLGIFEKTATFTTVDGIVELPEDFISPVVVRWQDNRVLRPITHQYIYATSDNPIGYTLNDQGLILYPKLTVDGYIIMTYNYRPLHMENDDDQPDLPNGWDRLIVDYAVARAHRKNGNIALYREYMTTYEAKKSSLATELVKRLSSRVDISYDQDNPEYKPFNPFDYLLL